MEEFSLNYFPVEIICQIFANINDPDNISELFASIKNSDYLESIAKSCITRLEWNEISDRDISADFVNKFIKIEDVEMPILCQDEQEFMSLSKLSKSKKLIIKYPGLRIFNAKARNDDIINGDISLITEWYINRSENGFFKNKNIRLGWQERSRDYYFIGDSPYYINISDNTLEFSLGTYNKYMYLYPLMYVINETEGLNYISQTQDKVNNIRDLGINFPNITGLISNGTINNINDYLLFTNVNTIKYNHWDVLGYLKVIDKMSSLIENNLYLENGTLVPKVQIEKPVYLEIPIDQNQDVIQGLLITYPKVKLLSLYIYEMNDVIVDIIFSLLRRNIKIIIYTNMELVSISSSLKNNPNVSYRKYSNIY